MQGRGGRRAHPPQPLAAIVPTELRLRAALSLRLAAIGLVLWVGGGPHPRTRGAWLLLVAILIVAALPALLYWMFC